MMTSDRTHFDELKDQTWQAILSGQLRKALSLCDESLDWARERGEAWQVDRALCNRAAILVELGESDSFKTEMQRILMANRDAENSFLAAYALSHAYELDKNFDKAVFYARIAQRHANSESSPERQAACHNLIANILIAQSKFDDARNEIELSLRLLSSERDHRRGIALDNLGYCHIVQGRHRQGFTNLFAAARLLRRAKARAWLPINEVSLCFAYLEVGRYRSAIRHAIRALSLAEEMDNPEMRKNSLFLLGEAFKQSGDPLAARRQFARLQEEFYPNAQGVADLLLLINVKKLVNIKAL